MDVSFISATLLLPRLAEFAPRAELLVLVKPQFEVGPEQVGKGGVVRDDALRAQAVARVREAAAALGYGPPGRRRAGSPGPRATARSSCSCAPAQKGTGLVRIARLG